MRSPRVPSALSLLPITVASACGGSLDGFGTVRDATLAIGSNGDGGVAAIGLLSSTQRTCEDGTDGPGEPSPCSFLLEVLSMGGEDFWGSSSGAEGARLCRD